MTEIKDFSDLGNDFQKKLISQVIFDPNFGLTILPILEAKYFDNQFCKKLVVLIKNYNKKYMGSIPSLTGLKEAVLADVVDVIEKNQIIAVLKELPDKAGLDSEQTKDMSIKFCKQQELIRAISDANKIIKRGEFESYNEIHEIFSKALTVGEREKNTFDILENIDLALQRDYRNPIPTGVDGLDDAIGGGLGKKEFGILIMPTGTGKTTLLSKIANNAYRKGFKVLQIFFEDNVMDIQRKHASALTHIALNDLPMYADLVKDKLIECSETGGLLTLRKCSSDSTSVSDIRQYLMLMKSKGIIFDMIVVDYIDCLVPNKHNDDTHSGEGAVIRQLEALCGDEDVVLWSAVQSNRAGASADVVEVDMIQGSFKRAQVGHLIISVAKTHQQKELGLATMAILKSRFGGDGKIFKNMTFDNVTMNFDTKESTLLATYEFDSEKAREEKEVKHQALQSKALQLAKDAKAKKEAAKLNGLGKRNISTPTKDEVADNDSGTNANLVSA